MIIEWIPRDIALALPVFALLLVGVIVERHYVSRVTCFTNGIAVTVHALTTESTNVFVYAYADMALIVGAVGFVFYAVKESTGWWYNLPAFFLFSSWTTGLVILLPAEYWWLAILFGIGGQVVVDFVYEDAAFYFGDDPWPASQVKTEVREEIERRQRVQALRDSGLL